MMPIGRWLLVVGVAVCVATLAQSKPSDKNQLEVMADALKMLQELDRYYSQVARPSPRSESGRTQGFEVARVKNRLKMLQLQEYDRMYAPRNRPRFGKRADLRPVPDDEAFDDASSEHLWHRFARRR